MEDAGQMPNQRGCPDNRPKPGLPRANWDIQAFEDTMHTVRPVGMTD